MISGRGQIWRGEGRDVLRQLGEGLDELHARTSTPITARRPWLQAWIDCFPDYHPIALALTGPDGGPKPLRCWRCAPARWSHADGLWRRPQRLRDVPR